MKLCLLTYADFSFCRKQKRLVEHARELKIFDMIFSADRVHLQATEFYKSKDKNLGFLGDNILDCGRGGGYWIWKPYYILECLKIMEEGDVLLYLDSGDWIDPKPEKADLLELMKDKHMLLSQNGWKNSAYTKRDCFTVMGCDSQEYWDADQVEAGVILMRKTGRTIEQVEEWFKWCNVDRAIDDKNDGENFPDFVEHRWDQSILTNLSVKNSSGEGAIMMSDWWKKYIRCNVQPDDTERG